jgi:hypothetical protein
MEEEYPEWKWEAHYTDGSVLKQYDEEYHKAADIDQSRLAAFALVHETKPPVIIGWRPSLKLTSFYYRVRKTLPVSNTLRIYCVDFHENGSAWTMVITPEGGVILTDNIDKIEVT